MIITEAVSKADYIQTEIENLMVWILNNDDNEIVKHEAAFQIGLNNMRTKIPDLINSILNDKSDHVKQSD